MNHPVVPSPGLCRHQGSGQTCQCKRALPDAQAPEPRSPWVPGHSGVQLTSLGAPPGSSGTREQGPELSPGRTTAAAGKGLLLQGARPPGARSTSGPHERRRARPHLHRPSEEDARVRRQLLHVEVHGAPVRRAAAPAPEQPAAPRPSRLTHPAAPRPPAACARPLRARVCGRAERRAGPGKRGGARRVGRGFGERCCPLPAAGHTSRLFTLINILLNLFPCALEVSADTV